VGWAPFRAEIYRPHPTPERNLVPIKKDTLNIFKYRKDFFKAGGFNE